MAGDEHSWTLRSHLQTAKWGVFLVLTRNNADNRVKQTAKRIFSEQESTLRMVERDGQPIPVVFRKGRFPVKAKVQAKLTRV
jgi:hypothetical protein